MFNTLLLVTHPLVVASVAPPTRRDWLWTGGTTSTALPTHVALLVALMTWLVGMSTLLLVRHPLVVVREASPTMRGWLCVGGSRLQRHVPVACPGRRISGLGREGRDRGAVVLVVRAELTVGGAMILVVRAEAIVGVHAEMMVAGSEHLLLHPLLLLQSCRHVGAGTLGRDLDTRVDSRLHRVDHSDGHFFVAAVPLPRALLLGGHGLLLGGGLVAGIASRS